MRRRDSPHADAVSDLVRGRLDLPRIVSRVAGEDIHLVSNVDQVFGQVGQTLSGRGDVRGVVLIYKEERRSIGAIHPRVIGRVIAMEVQVLRHLRRAHRVAPSAAVRSAGWRRTTALCRTIASMRVRMKQSSACSGVSTIGSFSLKLVLSTTGTPVILSNSLISA